MVVERAKAAWDEVGSSFTGLGVKLKEHFAQAANDEGGGERSDAAAREALRDALHKLGAAFEDAVAAISAASKDQAITDDVRKLGQSVVHAFQSTFEDVGDDLRQAFGRGKAAGS
jgi:hypothetical protein